MIKDIYIGTAVIFLALAFMVYLIVWSRSTIEYIRKKKISSAREITKSLHERR
ncbi:MAG: hypothetical protein PVH84_04380 [Candidatus Aminicenantes bacterium]|jgi:hypothetical protein